MSIKKRLLLERSVKAGNGQVAYVPLVQVGAERVEADRENNLGADTEGFSNVTAWKTTDPAPDRPRFKKVAAFTVDCQRYRLVSVSKETERVEGVRRITATIFYGVEI